MKYFINKMILLVFLIMSFFSASFVFADHHIDCVAFASHPECTTIATPTPVSEENCIAVFDSTNNQLNLYWVNLGSANNVNSRFKNVILNLISSDFVFQVFNYNYLTTII